MLSKIFFASFIWFVGLLPHASPTPAPLTPGYPYYISNLQKRTYSSHITIEKAVLTSAKYNSYIIRFTSDELTEYGLINIPVGSIPPSGWPVIILNHGHIAPTQYSTAQSYNVPAADFAKAGFLVLKPDFRGNGHSQGTADNLTSRLEYSVDVLNLLSAVKDLSMANPRRIYFWGHSMGGDVTLRAMEICGNCIKAASLWAPAVTDWPESMLFFVRRNNDSAWLSRIETELHTKFSPQDYTHISAFANIRLVKVPLNLHQGTSDESVPYAWGVALDRQLTENQIPHNFFSYPDDDHNLTRNWATAVNRDVTLFNLNQ